MPPRALRATTRKEAANLPQQQQIEHLLDISRTLSESAPKLSAFLSRRALVIADTAVGALLPRAVASTICLKCGAHLTDDAFKSGKIFKLSKAAIRRQKRKTKTGPQQRHKEEQQHVNRAAILTSCTLCKGRCSRFFYQKDLAEEFFKGSSSPGSQPPIM